MIIGYRMVSEAEANLINQNHELLRDESYDNDENADKSLGYGIYMVRREMLEKQLAASHFKELL
ncbi:hypothetical protein LZ554_006168 [Drepanopeziza brunnea f. sp. 'monogermtubi']|nr:hypothetical protein LZ554_006168 [Drepanopeziza brunnea f. sp. 'monogermtubi']